MASTAFLKSSLWIVMWIYKTMFRFLLAQPSTIKSEHSRARKSKRLRIIIRIFGCTYNFPTKDPFIQLLQTKPQNVQTCKPLQKNCTIPFTPPIFNRPPLTECSEAEHFLNIMLS